jgi:RNA polymerase sigma factor (sigma-70 family)
MLPDRELIQRFVIAGDQAAFEALVSRHGPMVLGVCRRILRDDHDADDAFQATFLVLARKAATLRDRDSVGNWLYGVATRLALRARTDAARRLDRESRAPLKAPVGPLADLTIHEAQQILDEELTRLPAKYRAPLVLCCLEGLARDEAAEQLGCGAATVKSRLERAREILRQRLSRRGLMLPVALFATLLAESPAAAALSPLLLKTAAKAAAVGAVVDPLLSPTAVALAEEGLRLLSASRLKVAALILVATLVFGGGAAVVLRSLASRDANVDPAVAALTDDATRSEAALTITEKPAPREDPHPVTDWPQWRGRNRDGVVQGVRVPENWPGALPEEWQVAVGEGVASPVVVGGHVFVFTRQQEQEVLLCLDLQGGKELWRTQPYPAPYQRSPEERNFSLGPRSTPTVAGGRVYTLGLSGILSCVDARTGTLLWRKDGKPNTAAAPRPSAHAYGGSSPLLTGGLCIVHVGDGTTGGLTAFDALNGEQKWCFSEGYSPMSGSPIIVELAGERQVVTYSSSNATGVSVATGTKLWKAGADGVGQPHTTPILYRDLLILNDILQPLRALRLHHGKQSVKVEEVWKSRGLPLGYSSPVVAGDHVFGMSTRKNGCFFCLDAASGKTLWESPGNQGDYASILNAGSVLLMLNEKGRLSIVRPSATEYDLIAEYRVSDTDTHATPVFLGDRILIKDHTTLKSFRIGPDATSWR